jgi:ABC-2 type transport system permease protein
MNRKNRILLLELTKTDFKLRYQGSILGYMWAIIRPLLMFGILYVVFAKFLRFGDDISHYPVYLLVGTVLWNFFLECTNQGIQSLIIRSDLMRKISFDRIVIVLSATATALINLSINLFVILIFACLSNITPNLTWLIVPFLIFELYILALGIALLLGSLNVKFRDVGSIWEVLTQALFYAIPIIYPLTMVLKYNKTVAEILILNPIAQIIQDVRYFIVTNETLTVWNMLNNSLCKIIPFLIVLVVFLIGLLVFRKRSKYFAEEI